MVQRQQAEARLVDFEVQRVDMQVVFDEANRQVRIALGQRVPGILQLRFHRAAHQQELLCEITQLDIEMSFHRCLSVKIALARMLSPLTSFAHSIGQVS